MTKVKEMFLASKKYKYFQTDVIKYITRVLQLYRNSFLLLFKYYVLGAQFLFLNKAAYVTISYSHSLAWLLAPFWQTVMENKIDARLTFQKCQTKSWSK